MMPERQTLISIITVNYNELAVTAELLQSLKQLAYWPGSELNGKLNFEIFVVDNGSPENAYPALSSQFSEIFCIRSDENLGFAGGNNIAVQQCRGDFLFFINNDTIPTAGLVEQLLDVFEQNPSCGIVSPKICYDPADQGGQQIIQYAGTSPVSVFTARNQTFGAGQRDKGQFADLKHTAYAHGAAMMVPRQVIQMVGPLPEAFFLYYEELDWCEQIKRAGFEVMVEPRALIYHKESLAVQKVSALKTFYLTRSRLLFMRRNRTGLQFLLFLLFFLLFTAPKASLLHLLKGEWPQLKAFWKAVYSILFGSKTHWGAQRIVAGSIYATSHSKPV